MYKKHLIFLIFIAMLSGCTRLGGAYQRDDLPPGVPNPVVALQALSANESAIVQFMATGEFMLQSPDIAGVQALRQSTIYFQYPAALHIIGRKYTSVVMKMTCAGDAFVLEFPTEKEYVYREQGEYIPEIDEDVTPAWIAREMFRPADWSAIPEDRLRVAAYDETGQRLVLEVFKSNKQEVLERRLELTGPPWVLKKSELFGNDGQLLALTEKRDYREIDGNWFPAEVETRFPQTGTMMRISMRKIYLNVPMEDSLFDLKTALQRLNAEKYRQVEAYEEVSFTP